MNLTRVSLCDGEVTVVELLQERLHSDHKTDMQDQLLKHALESNARRFIVDLTAVLCIASGATSALVVVRKRLQDRGIQIRFCGLNKHITEMYRTFRFVGGSNPLFDVRDTRDGAINDPWQ